MASCIECKTQLIDNECPNKECGSRTSFMEGLMGRSDIEKEKRYGIIDVTKDYGKNNK